MEQINLGLRIMVVYGGVSTEREVSLRSGMAVYEALLRYGFRNVTLFDLKADNIEQLLAQKPDVCFLALHGKGGEDGSIQGLLELAQIPYTGPGVAASAVCMNKILTKQILEAAGLPTAKFAVVHKEDCVNVAQVTQMLVEKIGLPMVLKSPCQGSSIGVIIVKNKEQMPEAIREIFSLGDQLLAEQFLRGTEITLPILGNEELTVLPDIEITSEREFYDFTAKYTSGLCHHIIPARISEEDRQKASQIGQKAYKILGCCGLSRIDFIIDEKEGPMVIEVNTLPGMTEMSLFPDSARSIGISFEELTARIVALGLEAHRETA